ncbi:lon protease 1 [Perilla frutescens var. hirtella]|nr:lon protease 1 [Perilla frutescens var. hirtella]
MLKVLTTRCSSRAAFGAHIRRGEPASPLLRLILGQNKGTPYILRRFFCSDSTDGSDPDDAKRVKSPDAAAESSSAIVPTIVRPEDCLTVIALPLSHRPLFPGFYMPVYVKDPKLLAALIESRKRQAPYTGAFLVKDEEEAEGSDSDKNIFDLKGKDLFNRLREVGTLAQITSIQGDQVVLIGHRRLRITEMVSEDPLTVKVDHLKEIPYDKDDDILKATSFEVISTLRDVLKTSPLWRDHAQTYIQHVGDFTYPRVADFGAAISGANKQQCQQVLEELDVHKRLKLTLELVKKEMEISKIQESIAKAIEEKISGEQRRYLLNEQLKAIKKELGLETDDKTALSAKFRERLDPKKEKIPAHVLQVIEEELTKLQLLEASSSEFNVTRNYLDWLTALPWGEYSDENFDVIRAQEILDEDHYGLTDVKERILEFIAVGKLRGTSQGKIVCLSGPPGVGKTSIGRSIARALNRKFYRFSVGGLSDVAEIKGHRRTYIGAMPGKMVQCLKSVGTANPLVLIDEIDKLGRGHAGDPASAMLELLDPEQNANFLDHYLDVSIDLSKVLFVCTANVVEMIPNPLLDRMEVISIAGYITDEKMHIARDYLEKSTREACGIKPEQVEVTDSALLALIENYCREAGVRNLQKQIEKIYRKIALQLVRQGVNIEPVNGGTQIQPSETNESSVGREASENATEAEIVDFPANKDDTIEAEKNEASEAAKKVEKVLVDSSNLVDFVGKPVFHAERIYAQTPVGVVMGLAWTAMGGSTLYIETSQVEQGEGKGALNVTGQLGDVMKESAQIAYTVARAILLEKDPENHFFANTKLHLHVPAGATPKDGPSAGCTMITSMLSLAMNKPVKKDLAMTGEVTLTRKILPIGGVKEKTIAARRSEVKTMVFPSANRRDFDELAANVKAGIELSLVSHLGRIIVDAQLGFLPSIMACFAPKFSFTPSPICTPNHKSSISFYPSRKNPFFRNHSKSGSPKLHPNQLLVFSGVNGSGDGGNGVREMERPKLKRVRVSPNLSEEQKRAMSQLPLKMTNRCKSLMKEIICFSAENGSLPRMLASWVKNTKPQRADWLAVLKELERLDHSLYFEVEYFLLKYLSLTFFDYVGWL